VVSRGDCIMNILSKWFNRYFFEEEALLLFAILVVGTLVVVTMGNVLAPVIASIILAYLMEGLTVRLIRRGVPERLAVWATFAVFIGFFFAVLLVLLPLAWQQLTRLFAELPGMASRIQALLIVLPQEYPSIFTEAQIRQFAQVATSELGNIGQYILSFSLASIPNLIGLLIYVVLVPILVFFFLNDHKIIIGWMSGFLPAERPLIATVSSEMNQQIANYARGKALEIVVVGLVTYAAFSWMGLNYAALLALIVGLSVLIPYIGAAVVTLPVALIAYFQWGWGSEFLSLLLVHGVIQALDGNVLVPLLFSEAVNLHPVAIVLAVLVFGGLWGLWGVFFAIPLATLVKAVMNAWPVPESVETES